MPNYPLYGSGDVNCDGAVNSWDVSYLARNLVGMPNYPLCGA